MKIAIMGIRGIPANYGGFETMAEELAPRLVARGHEVWVYCRAGASSHAGNEYRSVNLVKLPTIRRKYLDTPVHTILSVLHSLVMRFDVVLMCNGANAVFAWIPRLSGARVAINVDGIERQRAKWGVVGRWWYRLGELLAHRVANCVVADARVIERYYRERIGVASVFIPYGFDPRSLDTTTTLDALGVRPRDYVLYVSRLEPENNAHLVIEAFREVRTSKHLVVVGDAPYADAYKRRLRKLADGDGRIIMPGAIYGDGYRELGSHAYCYVQATQVGGTHPALVEAMGFGNCVVANRTPENEEVLGDSGLFYSRNDARSLRLVLQWVLDHEAEAEEYRGAARDRARARYQWENVADEYDALCRLLCPARFGDEPDSVGR